MAELTLANRGTTEATVTLTCPAASAFGGSGSGSVSLSVSAGRQLVVEDAIGFLRTRGLGIPAGSQGGTLRASFDDLSAPDAAYAGVRITAPSESSGCSCGTLASPALAGLGLFGLGLALFALRRRKNAYT